MILSCHILSLRFGERFCVRAIDPVTPKLATKLPRCPADGFAAEFFGLGARASSPAAFGVPPNDLPHAARRQFVCSSRAQASWRDANRRQPGRLRSPFSTASFQLRRTPVSLQRIPRIRRDTPALLRRAPASRGDTPSPRGRTPSESRRTPLGARWHACIPQACLCIAPARPRPAPAHICGAQMCAGPPRRWPATLRFDP